MKHTSRIIDEFDAYERLWEGVDRHVDYDNFSKAVSKSYVSGFNTNQCQVEKPLSIYSYIYILYVYIFGSYDNDTDKV